ncbi:hypothetical protein HQ865_22670 [Mucilaginibacter mali]|uniref:Uncharacterized protein n=1 Tax=Mucilaginibacter mali TaxID=2740462 RepID=A0A7D4Q3T6_9SPHI|nr:hypothetical protein [Mucilaginibacter mali]QKJ32446.1 hypothetical protein HQ865_22670 [Mucilaginibacter mali]
MSPEKKRLTEPIKRGRKLLSLAPVFVGILWKFGSDGLKAFSEGSGCMVWVVYAIGVVNAVYYFRSKEIDLKTQELKYLKKVYGFRQKVSRESLRQSKDAEGKPKKKRSRDAPLDPEAPN